MTAPSADPFNVPEVPRQLVGLAPEAPDVTGVCPNCKNVGPHPAFADPRDPEFVRMQPVQCVGCGYEFAVTVSA